MKIFTNKNLIQKLVVAIVCVTLFNFCIVPTRVEAANKHTVGGELFDILKEFTTFISDAAVSLIQSGFVGEWIDAVDKNESGKVVGTDTGYFKSKINYPIIQISPELIFANRIQMLDVNFIGTNSNLHTEAPYIKAKTGSAISTLRSIIASWYVTLRTIAIVGLLSVLIYIGIRIIISSTSQDKAKYKQRLMDWVVAFCLLFFMHYIMIGMIRIVEKTNDVLYDVTKIESGIELDSSKPNVVYAGPQKIANGRSYDISDVLNEIETSIKVKTNDSEEISWIDAYGHYLHRVDSHKYEWISKYNVDPDQFIEKLDNTEENIVLEYIFETITDSDIDEGTLSIYLEAYKSLDGELIVKSGYANTNNNTAFEIDEFNKYMENVVEGEYNNSKVDVTYNGDIAECTNLKGKRVFVTKQSITEGDGSKILYFINYARLYLENDSAADNVPQAAGYLIIYIVLVVFTCMFTIRYIKRVIYIAFLTMMAPLVALTYPLDKLRDGKAQAFNLWFREYLFNLLIQPFHLILYTVLVGTAMDLVTASPIYAIVAIAFLVPAEKLLRKFFGFDNAGTLSAAGSFAGGALFSAMINKINRPKPKDEDEKEKKQVRKANSKGGINSDEVLTGASSGVRTSTNSQHGNAEQRASGVRTSQQGSSVGNDNEDNAEDVFEQGWGGIGNSAWTEQNRTGENEVEPSATGDSSSRASTFSLNADHRFKEAKEHSRIHRLMSTGGAALGDASRDFLRKRAQKALKGAKTMPRKLTRKALGGFAGASLGIIGAGVGIASGDPSKAMQYAMAGGAAGYSLGNYYGDKIAKGIGDTVKDADQAFFGEDWKSRKQYLFDREFKNNADNINAIANVAGRDEAIEAMHDGTVQACLENNITDPSKVAKVVGLRNKFMDSSSEYYIPGISKDEATERAIAMAMWNRDSGKGIYDKNSRSYQVWRNLTIRQVLDGSSISEEEAAEKVDNIFKALQYIEF